MLKYFIEIKNWVLLLIINFCCTVFITYFYKEILLFLIAAVLNSIVYNTSVVFICFIFTDISEILTIYVSLLKFVVIQVFYLYFCYNIFIFISFGFFKQEYFFFRFFLTIFLSAILVSIILTIKLIIPSSFQFFLGLQESIKFSVQLNFEAKLKNFFSLYISFYFVCLFYFQILTVLLIILYCLNINKKIIWKFWKTLYLFLIIIFTLLTPEIVSQVLLSLIFVIINEFLLLLFLIKINLKF